MGSRKRRWAILAALSVSVSLTAGIGSPASAGGDPPPSIRLFATDSHITVKTDTLRRVRRWVPLGMWVTATGGAFELQASRSDYQTPVNLVQTDALTGDVVRDLPDDLFDDWFGLTDFFHLTIRNAEGKWVASRRRDFCPNESDHQRIDDSGPARPRYPFYCGGHPFTRGMVWGIDQGWAVGAFGWRGAVAVPLKPGDYTVTLKVNAPYRGLLDIPSGDRSVTIDLTVKFVESARVRQPARSEAMSSGQGTAETGVPEDTDPDPATLPDLVALPAFSLDAYHSRGRDLLGFNATEWNEGPAPLVVEAFRRQDQSVMDAYQYFYDGETAVGRAPAGTMRFHADPSHHHWHFKQFTAYTLLDATMTEVVASNKQAWCLAPTDAIDLTVDGAEYTPGNIGLHTACGEESSIWVREILDVGWGDTYSQFSQTQAFDITEVPNGEYIVRVEVNPEDRLYEADTSNNVELRMIELRGQPGNRRVIVPPWNGIDTG